jgi:hypothetical protein
MDPLQAKALEYEELLPFDHLFSLQDGRKVLLVFRESNFPHLLGLHKLTDIPMIRLMGSRSRQSISPQALYKIILKGNFGMDNIVRSAFFQSVSSRIDAFGTESLEAMLYKLSVVDFDPNRIITDMLKARFLFVRQNGDHWEHLAIGRDIDKDSYFPLSFFVDVRDYYFFNQRVVDIVKYDKVRHKIGRRIANP